MRRRVAGGVPLGLLAALGAGFAALVVGVVVLFGVVLDERDEALARSASGRATLELLAAGDLERELDRDLHDVEAAVARALADPLAPADDLALVMSSEVVLPRPTRPAAPDASRARELLAALDAGPTSVAPSRPGAPGGPGGPNGPGSREALARAVAAPGAVDAWLDHRVHFALAADVDLATTVFALETLDRAGALDPARAQALLRDGVARPDGLAPGLFAGLLRARPRLSAADLDALVARAAALARRYTVRVDDLLARVREPARDGLPEPVARAAAAAADATDVRRPTLACAEDRCWALRRTGDGRVVGRAVDLAGHLAAIGARYVAARRVDPAARVVVAEPATGAVAIASPEWQAEADTSHARFLLKAIPLGAVAALGAVVFALAVLLQRRRAAYIDLRSHLLGAVTHELKTPLASIRALAETLERRLDGAPAARDYPSRIVASAERLGFLVDNVLSFARLERGAWRPRVEPVAVADLAGWLAADVVPRAARPVDLALALPPGLAVMADPDLLRLLVSNLVDNAARYATAERVAVRVAATSDARGVHLAVSDDGPGLGGGDPARLFDDARRGDHARPAERAVIGGVRGTGLGLSICRMVMRLHGGAIRVAASSPAGTTFEATFPHRAAARAAAAPLEEPS